MAQPSLNHPGRFARMEPGRALSVASRSLSSSSLKERLSKLSVAPLSPVAALQANIELRPSLCLSPNDGANRWISDCSNQFRSVENTEKEETADDGCGHLVCTHAAHVLCVSAAMVRPIFCRMLMAC